jgi:hypothetical protein
MAATRKHMRILWILILGLSIFCGNKQAVLGQEQGGESAAAQASGSNTRRRQYAYPVAPDHIRPQAIYPQRRRSIVHHYPYPYPGYYTSDSTAGFRNPGGVGKFAEYYPPGNQFQVQGDPVRVAQFGVGGYPSRAEQMQAQQLGISRYNSIQNHIDNYAMPHWGYGFGVGGFGGFW